MHSKLFVPGGRPELFAKALAGDADALSFDLEDSVPVEGKQAARAAVADALAGDAVRGSRKQIIVRVNSLGSKQLPQDLETLAGLRIDLLNLTKIDSADDVRESVSLLERLEPDPAVQPPVRLLITIETPAALRNAAAIAAAHPRVAGLQLGLGDLFEPFGIDREDPASLHAVMFAVRMAAAEAGLFVLDGAHPGIQDTAGFELEARLARRLGFAGKSCIHPRQVPLANRIFSVSAQELAAAQRIVDAAQVAAINGHGAFMVDGRMVDWPYLQRARAVLADATRHGGGGA